MKQEWKYIVAGIGCAFLILFAVAAGPIFQATGFTVSKFEARSATTTPIVRINQLETGGDGGVPLLVEYLSTPVMRVNSAGGGVDFWINATPVASIDSSGVNTFGKEAIYMRLQDVADDTATNVLAETLAVSTTTSITTSITNPDYPRNILITYLTVTTATAGNITVTGVDARGNIRTSNGETFAVTAISGTQVITGSIPWATLTEFALPTHTESISISVGLGEKFGLGLVPSTSAEVFFFTIGNVYTSAYTVDTTWGTVLPTADIAANNDLTIGYQK